MHSGNAGRCHDCGASICKRVSVYVINDNIIKPVCMKFVIQMLLNSESVRSPFALWYWLLSYEWLYLPLWSGVCFQYSVVSLFSWALVAKGIDSRVEGGFQQSIVLGNHYIAVTRCPPICFKLCNLHFLETIT